MLISQSEYARRKGWSAPYINKLVKQGKIPRGRGGKVDPAKADAALAQIQSPTPRMPAAGVRPAASPPETMPVSFLQARTVRETYKAKREKLEYERLAGKLLDADHVLQIAEQSFSNVRTRMRGLAKSLAPIMATTTTSADAERILIEAVDGALESLSANIFEVPHGA